MIKKTIEVSILNIVGFIFQFLLSIVISNKFGLGFQLDVYNKSIAIPNYLILMLSSSITYIFIPLYSNIYKKNKSEASKITNEYFIAISIFALFLLSLSYIFSDYFLKLFNKQNQNLDVIKNVFFVYIPIIFFSTLIEFLNTIFYTNDNFKLPLIMKIINPILVTIFISNFESKSIYIAIAYLIAYFIHFFILFLNCIKKYFYFKFEFSFSDLIKQNVPILKLTIPLIFSIILTKALPIFDVYFLSSYNNGVVSNVLLSQKLISTISFVINSFFSIIFFSKLSTLIAENNYNKFIEILFISINTILFITLPIVFFLLHNSGILFQFLFGFGKFNSIEIFELTKSFKFFLFGLPVIAIGSVISYAIYSLRTLKIFYFSSVIEIIIYTSIAYLFKFIFHQNSIPFAFVINFLFSDLILLVYLYGIIRKKCQFNIKFYDYKLILFSVLFFLPYYFFPPNTIFIDLIFFLFSTLFYIFFLFKFKFSPIQFLIKSYSSSY